MRHTAQWGRTGRAFAAALLLFVTSHAGPVAAREDAVARRLHDGGSVLLIRHALAPGIGDPDGFRLDDCATQRNLSDEGRRQARAIGDWLRARGIGQARVYSSQWCRCLETAALLGLGPVTPLPALNSFFDRRQDREPILAALREFLATQPHEGGLLVLVTHQVTISAVSDTFADAGTGVLMALGERGRLERIGTLAFGGARD